MRFGMALENDVGMETNNTCPSPEIGDSRKRPLDGDNSENGSTKRSHFSSGESTCSKS
jgi:RNA-binding protein Nova